MRSKQILRTISTGSRLTFFVFFRKENEEPVVLVPTQEILSLGGKKIRLAYVNKVFITVQL